MNFFDFSCSPNTWRIKKDTFHNFIGEQKRFVQSFAIDFYIRLIFHIHQVPYFAKETFNIPPQGYKGKLCGTFSNPICKNKE